MRDIAKRPIGIFDSGIGGLTVVAEIIKRLPNEDIVYFGDTGRYPYGGRSPEVIKRFSRQNVRFLLMKKVKYIIVACNTASSLALNSIKRNFDIPMIGVIKPGAYGAVSNTKNKKIGVIGTVGTVSSSSYTKAIAELDKNVEVTAIATPLLVALAEEGYVDKPASMLIIKDYLSPLRKRGIDTLVLGCTHFPLLRKAIGSIMGKDVMLIDSAEWTVKMLKEDLLKRNLLKNSSSPGKYRYFVSDTPDKFAKVGSRFLGATVSPVKKVNIEKY